MGLAKVIAPGLIELFGNEENQFVEAPDRLEVAVAKAKKAKGKSNMSIEDADILLSNDNAINVKGEELDQKQRNSVMLYASDIVIRAKNGLEKWIKQRKTDKKLITKLDKNFAAKGDLPKDYIVSKAEETNGKIPQVSASELENQPREKGGRIRDSRTRK